MLRRWITGFARASLLSAGLVVVLNSNVGAQTAVNADGSFGLATAQREAPDDSASSVTRGTSPTHMAELAFGTVRAPDWRLTRYPYAAMRIDIARVLDDFAANNGVPLERSDNLSGVVRGYWPDLSPQAYLNRVTARLALDWYYDGSVLYVTSPRDRQDRILQLGGLSIVEIVRALDGLDIADPRYPIRYDRSANILAVSGPPRYVDLVEQTLSSLRVSDALKMTVIRGRTNANGAL